VERTFDAKVQPANANEIDHQFGAAGFIQ